MANKRMFNMTIVDSDAFLEMPLSAQCLYFHLNMRADDDGFIGNSKRIMRLIGASDDDLRLLIMKSFVLTFEDGVIVIKHWRIHNTLSSSRYHQTVYMDEKTMLKLKDNGAYTFNDGTPIDDTKYIEMFKTQQVENKWRTSGEQVENVEEYSIDKYNNILISKDINCQTDAVRLCVEHWNTLKDFGISPVSKLSASSKRYKCLNARIKEYGYENIIIAIDNIKNSPFLLGRVGKNPFFVTFDWFVLPNNFIKVYEGNYIKTSNDANCQNVESTGDGRQ